VATPGFLKARIESRDCTLNLKHLKMVIVDEADQLFLEESSTNADLNFIINTFFKNKL
jgi:superfamily II DNA/RNA helicase